MQLSEEDLAEVNEILRNKDKDKNMKILNNILKLSEDGKILNEGTHEYLLDNCEEYKKLYETEINKLED